MRNLRSYSVDVVTGQRFEGATRVWKDAERFVHVLVPAHEAKRFEQLPVGA